MKLRGKLYQSIDGSINEVKRLNTIEERNKHQVREAENNLHQVATNMNMKIHRMNFAYTHNLKNSRNMKNFFDSSKKEQGLYDTK